MTTEESILIQAEVDFEKALIDLRDARDGRGLRIMLGPRPFPQRMGSVCGITLPLTPADFRKATLDFMGVGKDPSWLDRAGEIAYARNLALLAKAWEMALRYEAVK